MVVPADTPDTVPELPIVATAVLLLLQVPPDVTSLRVIDDPEQTEEEPVILAGRGFTVTVVVTVVPVAV